jgi:hypothetical protein
MPRDLEFRRPRRKKESGGSLAPLFWALGIVGFLVVAAGVALVIVFAAQDDGKDRAAATGKETGKEQGGGGVPPAREGGGEAAPPIPAREYPPQVGVFPNVRGKDPLNPGPQLQQLLAAIDQQSPGWRLAEIEARRPALQPAQNSAIVVYQAASALPADWEAMPDGGIPMGGVPPTFAYPAGQAFTARAHLARARSSLAEARKLTDFPAGRYRVEWDADMLSTRLPHVQDVIKVSRLLSADAMLRGHEGDGDGAVRSCVAAVHAARPLGDEPIALSQLARAALLVVACHAAERALTAKNPASDQTLAAAQQAFATEAGRPALYGLYYGERAAQHFLLTNVANGDTALPRAPGVRLTPEDQAWMLGVLSRMMAAALRPDGEQGAEFAGLAAEVRGSQRAVKHLLPDPDKINRAVWRVTRRMQGVAVGLAAERYRLKHGKWPPDVNALVPDFVREVPLDPIDRVPVKLAHRPEGVAAYCVGPGVDSGGDFTRVNGDTVLFSQGIRILHPDRRR